MKRYPYLINEDSSGEEFQPIEEQDSAFDESWLQELIRKHPKILPCGEIEHIFYPLMPIGFEVSCEAGSIDNLFIARNGYLVLVETKLWKNPQAKREVIAQAIDYACSISKWNYGKLDEVVKDYTKKYEKTELNLIDWVENQSGQVEGGRAFFEEMVIKNLRLGRFLVLIVGDRIRPSVIEMVSHINKYPHLATNVALVELHCYHWIGQKEAWPILVIPNIIAQTEVIERSIVQVTVNQDGTYQVDARQEKKQEKDKERRRLMLTEESFWEILKRNAPDSYENIRSLIDKYQERDDITIDPRTSAIVIKLNLQDTGQQVSLFSVNTNAILGTCPKSEIEPQFSRAGLDPELVATYDSRMRTIMGITKKDQKDFYCPIKNVDINKFSSEVDELIQTIQRAEPNG